MSPEKLNPIRLVDLNATFIILILLGKSVLPPGDSLEQVRAFTRTLEFDYIAWSVDAAFLKFEGLPWATTPTYPIRTTPNTCSLTLTYFGTSNKKRELATLFADPNVTDPETASADLRADLAALYDQRSQLGPLAETILQNQVGIILDELNLTVGGRPSPPTLYHSTAIPHALIHLAPAEHHPSGPKHLHLPGHHPGRAGGAGSAGHGRPRSFLVVPIGGVGTYPTMIAQTSNLTWLSEVITHEVDFRMISPCVRWGSVT